MEYELLMCGSFFDCTVLIVRPRFPSYDLFVPGIERAYSLNSFFISFMFFMARSLRTG